MGNRFEGRGDVLIATLASDQSLASGYVAVGDCEITATMETENREVMSLADVLGTMTDRYPTSVKVNLKMIFREVTTANIARALLGTVVSVSSGTVGTGARESFSNLAVGDVIPLRNMDVSIVAGVDSTGSPVTLVAGTHFEVWNAKAGLLRILSLSGLTQPLKFDYTFGAHTAVPALNRNPVEYAVLANIYNIGKTSERGRLLVHRVQLNPPDEMAFIADKMAELSIDGSILKHDTLYSDSKLGGYWSYQKV